VATLFQDLVNMYYEIQVDNGNYSGEQPIEEEAFIIAFIHDFGQKLFGNAADLSRIESFIKKKIMDLGFDEREAANISKYVKTNPAETECDPSKPKWYWHLLWFADRLQGASNVADIVMITHELSQKLGMDLHTTYINAHLLQPMLKALVAEAVYRKLKAYPNPRIKAIPIATQNGILIISNEELGKIQLSWDEIINSRGDFLTSDIIEKFKKYSECCADEECLKKYGSKKSQKEKSKDKEYDKFTRNNCNLRDEAVLYNSKVDAYKAVLIYYGSSDERPVFSSSMAKRFINIDLKGVDFVKDSRLGNEGKELTCVMCGESTRIGFRGGISKLLSSKNIKTEKWSRKLPPINLNAAMSDVNNGFGICPLCLGEVIMFSKMQESGGVIFSISIKAPIYLEALNDLGRLAAGLKFLAESSLIGANSASKPSSLVDLLDAKKNINMVKKTISSGRVVYLIDAFSSKIYTNLNVKSSKMDPQKEAIDIEAFSGLLSSWGLYPITASNSLPEVPNDVLLTSYKGQKDAFNYTPSDRNLGRYTPYVALLLLSMEALHNANRNKRLAKGQGKGQVKEKGSPYVTQLLSYPPSYSPLLLQYSSPALYYYIGGMRTWGEREETMSDEELYGLCAYDDSRDVDYFVDKLALIMGFIAKKYRNRGSTYAYTKEIRNAMQKLLLLKSGEEDSFISQIAKAYVPEELYSSKNRKCFSMLLEGLMRSFTKKTKDMSIGSKIQLMNITLSAIAEIASTYSLDKQGSDFLNKFFSSSSS